MSRAQATPGGRTTAGRATTGRPAAERTTTGRATAGRTTTGRPASSAAPSRVPPTPPHRVPPTAVPHPSDPHPGIAPPRTWHTGSIRIRPARTGSARGTTARTGPVRIRTAHTAPQRTLRSGPVRPELRLTPATAAAPTRRRRTGFRSRRAPFVLLVVGLLVGTTLGLLVLNTAIAVDSLKATSLRTANAERVQDIERLEQKVISGGTSAELAADATKAGMVPAGPPAYLVIQPDGSSTVRGTAEPATAPATPPPSAPAPSTPAPPTTPAPPSNGTGTVPDSSAPAGD